MNFLVVIWVAALAAIALYGWSRWRIKKATEDTEIMRIRAFQVPQIYAAYARCRAELLETLKEPLLIEVEEQLFNESLVSRREWRANPNSTNEEKRDFHLSNLRDLHAKWELNHPELTGVHEQIGNIREALFILQYGTAEEVRNLMSDAKNANTEQQPAANSIAPGPSVNS
jgi:hypothetical protein